MAIPMIILLLRFLFFAPKVSKLFLGRRHPWRLERQVENRKRKRSHENSHLPVAI